MTFKYPLAVSSWDQAEYNALQQVIESGQFTMGDRVARFERDFADYLGSSYAVAVNSGSSANLLMVGALFYSRNDSFRLKKGDEVIVPAVSWGTTYFPLHQYGLKLRFVDIDLDTLNYDLEKLSAAVNNRTKLIVTVNLLGNPNDFDIIKSVANGITVIEDNCESLGAEYRGKKTGTFGLVASHSTFFSHHISTMEGGVIVTDDEEIYHILLSLRAHGWTRNLPVENRLCSKDTSNLLQENFRFVLPGYNVRPTEFVGALGIEQLKKIPDLVLSRRRNGLLMQEALQDHKSLMIQKEIGSSSWFGFSLVIKPGSEMSRDDLAEKLTSLGFEVRPIVAGNFCASESLRFMDYEIVGEVSNAEYMHHHGLYIGNQHGSMESAVSKIEALQES
jgi:CDP-6-deoxy-D-xylo-4-hexulose-3-dehydrase